MKLKNNVCALVFVILFSANFSFAAPSFFESIELSKPRISYPALLGKAEAFGLNPNHYLSLGESHLESDTSFPVLLELAKKYVGAEKNSSACLEQNTGLHHLGMQWLQESFQEIDLRKNNSPSRTDFIGCNIPNTKRKLIYSGFFHQYPWTSSFEGLFDQTPVQRDSANNIFSQMKPAAGFFVSEIELPVLINFEVRSLLKHLANAPTDAVPSIQRFSEKVQAVRTQMESISWSESDFKNKFGLVLSSDSFKSQINLPENFYFILTDLKYRLAQSASYFLEEVARLPSPAQEKFFLLLKLNRYVYQETDITPDALGVPGDVTANGGGVHLDGESSILWIISDAKVWLIANSNTPVRSGLQCFVKDKGSDAQMQKLPCELALSL